MRSPSAMSKFIRARKMAKGGDISKRYEVSSGSDEHHEMKTEAERRTRPTQQDKRDDDGASGAIESDRSWEASPEDKRDDDGALENHIDDSDQGSRSRYPKKIQEYAFGGRVLDERPGYDQGPEDSDLQDKEIGRMYETADQNDRNSPMHVDKKQGQNLSNESEDHQEEQEQPIHKDRNANHEDYEKELLRNVRMSRLRKSMSR
jgi:hypothetical protein